MKISYNYSGWNIEHDGLMVQESSLEDAIVSYGEGMLERGKKINDN